MKENEIYEKLKASDLTVAELNAKLKRLEELEKQEKSKAQNLAVKSILNLTKQHEQELERVRTETRKETAKEIFNALIVLINQSNLKLAILDKKDIREQAKDYGVIIE